MEPDRRFRRNRSGPVGSREFQRRHAGPNDDRGGRKGLGTAEGNVQAKRIDDAALFDRAVRPHRSQLRKRQGGFAHRAVPKTVPRRARSPSSWTWPPSSRCWSRTTWAKSSANRIPNGACLFAFEPNAEKSKPSYKVTHIMLEPINAEPFILRAETELESRYDRSLQDLQIALELQPENARANWLMGRVLSAMEQFEKAEAASAEAVRLEPKNARYCITHAQILGQMGRLREALQEAQKAIEHRRRSAALEGPGLVPDGRFDRFRPQARLSQGDRLSCASPANRRQGRRRRASGRSQGGEGSARRCASRLGARHRLGRLERQGKGRHDVAEKAAAHRRRFDEKRRRHGGTAFPRAYPGAVGLRGHPQRHRSEALARGGRPHRQRVDRRHARPGPQGPIPMGLGHGVVRRRADQPAPQRSRASVEVRRGGRRLSRTGPRPKTIADHRLPPRPAVFPLGRDLRHPRSEPCDGRRLGSTRPCRS